MELTILLPCLNENQTIAVCVKKAQKFLLENNIDGEVLISDNGSEDGSPDIAIELGARVINVQEKGYGSALISGTKIAKGKYIIMADCDDSYDLYNLMPFLEKLREGYDLVMGNRFKGGIDKGAMSFSHRYIGNPILSYIGKKLFKSNISDFHCGIRGYNKEAFLELNLQSSGMEYASEMVMKAHFNHLKITEIPTTLKKDGRDHPPHLHTLRDGWRHLKLLLMYAPKAFFIIPGTFVFLLGLILTASLLLGFNKIGHITFTTNTLIYLVLFMQIGFGGIVLGIITSVKFHELNPKYNPKSAFHKISTNKMALFGGIVAVIGICFAIFTLSAWSKMGFGNIYGTRITDLVLVSFLFLSFGMQLFQASFIIDLIRVERKNENG